MKLGAIWIALVVRFFALIGIVLVAVPLVAADPAPFPWGLAGGLAAAVITYLGTYALDYFAFLRAGREGHPHDVALFRELLDLLKPGDVRATFGEFDFGGAFRYDDIRELNRFAETWDTPDKEFRDKALEKARKIALGNAVVVAREIAFRTRPMGVGLQTVKLAGCDPQPESVRDDARVINEAATEFATSYEELIRLGRRRLTLT